MILVMRSGATEEQIREVIRRVEALGYKTHLSRGVERTIIGLVGDRRTLDPEAVGSWSGVEKALPILKPYKLACRDFQVQDTVISLGSLTVGGGEIVVMAGPCAVESREQIMETAWAVKEAGAKVLRGGAYKPRTSPYAFHGLGEEGLELLAEAREATGLLIVTEVMSSSDLPLVSEYANILQIGARNMQNFSLLHDIGESRLPVILKRGMSSTIEELLLAAEYILSHGNSRVILCERGIRTFETYTRNTFDVSAIAVLKGETHLPVIADPSHGTGRRELVGPVAKAAIAAGADGLLIEVHPHPDKAMSDGAQSLQLDDFDKLMKELRPVSEAVGRRL